jgi:hypothetical protein
MTDHPTLIDWPAYEAMGHDIRVGHACWRVWMHLIHTVCLSMHKPTEVKVWYLCQTLKMSPRSVINALDCLTQYGYLIDHGRKERRVRSLTFAYSVKPTDASVASASFPKRKDTGAA